MTKALGKEFEHIQNQLITIHWTWQNFRQLFATSKEHFDLFNERLPGFALLCHTVLIDSVILGICRLVDKAETKRQRNLTFEHLRNVISGTADPSQLAWLDAELAKIEAAAASLRKHRHKRIAHIDVHHALDESTLLPELSRKTIEDVLSLMRGVLQGISDWTDDVELSFYPSSMGDADSLIVCVQEADRLSELQDDYYIRRLDEKTLIEKLADRNFVPTAANRLPQ